METSPPRQMVLFEVEQTSHADGSFTVRPKAVAVTREIGAGKAGKMLGLCKEAIYRLCELGEEGGGLKAWQLPSARGNAKWRIDWQSAIGYRERREAAKRGKRFSR